MFMLNPHDKSPIFQQLKKQITDMVALGVLKENDQLPSVRALAGQLGINPNTVAKAYHELELEGLVYTIAGKGIFIKEAILSDQIINSKINDFKAVVLECKKYSISENKLNEVIKIMYKGGEEHA